MEMPLEFSSRAAWSSSCSRRDFAAVSMRRADAPLLLSNRIALIFYGAALRQRLGFLYAPSGDQVIQRGFHVFAALILVCEDLIIHGTFVRKLAVAIDHEEARCCFGAVAARDVAVDIEQEGSDCRVHLRDARTRCRRRQISGLVGSGGIDGKPHDLAGGCVTL